MALSNRTQARIACQGGDYAAAAASFEAALAAGEEMRAEDHYDHGAVLTALGRHLSAEAAYRRALQLRPEWPSALDNLAVALQHLHRLDEAEVVARRALAAHPAGERGFPLRNLGSLLSRRGRHDEAIDCYRQALQLSPDDAHAHHDLAAVYQVSNRLDAAEEHYRRACTLAPEWADGARDLAALLVGMGRTSEAEEMYRALLHRSPDDAEAASGLGLCLNAEDRLEEALAALELAVRGAPENELYHYNLGVVRERADLTDQAVSAYRQAIARAPEMVAAHSSLAAALYRLERLDEAHAAYRQVLALDPHDEVARHLSAAVSGESLPAAPAAYVAQVFDDYADRYDRHMVELLDYRAPSAIRALLLESLAQQTGLTVLDLGCGTGLMGHALGEHIGVMHGVDLSSAMLERARARGCYAELWCDDIVALLRDRDRGAPRYDVITAADVLVYIGDLGPLFAAARARLAPGGVLAFSVEAQPDGDPDATGYSLRTTGRYTHARTYIEATAQTHGLHLRAANSVHVRSEREVPVEALICALSLADG